ncbi:hypothetical protein Pyn_14131 [Prunus yedoensis var. nudiflora]|uniref:Uncharacterized protein n=1 Tax=Prunus yedoensis var. nudiflora TaxID=2094558 RepID=A0A314Y9Q8_PRUYE|nr:hypothetical protein Pyn_14131 [Prunus yedoensis var. nudiflora]
MQDLKARILASFTVLSLVYYGVVSTFLSLERVYPPRHRVQIEQLRARDRVRHARLLQNVAGGVVNFPVHGSSEPNLAREYIMLFRFEETPFWISQVTKVEEPCPALTGPTSDFSRHHRFAEMQGLKARILASFAVLSLVYCGVVSTFLSFRTGLSA